MDQDAKYATAEIWYRPLNAQGQRWEVRRATASVLFATEREAQLAAKALATCVAAWPGAR